MELLTLTEHLLCLSRRAQHSVLAHTLWLIFSSPHCSTSFEMIGSCKPRERASNEKADLFIAVPLQVILLCLSLKLQTSSPIVAEPLCSDFDSLQETSFAHGQHMELLHVQLRRKPIAEQILECQRLPLKMCQSPSFYLVEELLAKCPWCRCQRPDGQ